MKTVYVRAKEHLIKVSYLDHHYSSIFKISSARYSDISFAHDTFYRFMGGTNQPKLKISFG